MIRFQCPQCKEPVRVSDSFAGKKGRCPFCKHIYRIPTESQADGVADLAAALTSEEPAEPEATPPPPPHEIEDLAGAGDAELLPSTDPRSQTMPLAALKDQPEETYDLAEADEVRPKGPTPPTAPSGPKTEPIEEAAGKGRKLWLLIGVIGAVIVLGGGAAAVLLLTDWFKGGAAKPRPGTPPATTQLTARHAPTTQTTTKPAPAAKVSFPLSPEIAAASATAPAGAYCMFHVDLAATADGLAKFPAGSPEAIARIAASRLWTDAAERIKEGSMPATATLFLASPSAPASEVFGPAHGMLPGGVNDPRAGLWSLIKPESPVPQFLLRLGGQAAKAYDEELRGRAGGVGLDVAPAGQVAAAGSLRMVGPDAAAEPALLVGTDKTLGQDARPIGNPEQLQRLRALLAKVQTQGRPVVGGVVLANLRKTLQEAVGEPQAMPPWAGANCKLIFSLDPSPAPTAQATIVITDSDPAALEPLKAKVDPMVVAVDGTDVRITGTGAQGLGVLAGLLPGFDAVVMKGLAMAEPVRSRLAVATAPAPTPTPEPTPAPTPEPAPQPTPAPTTETAPAGPPIDFTCLDSTCQAKGTDLKVDSNKVTPNMLAGTDLLKCPRCGKSTAVPAVQCPHCKKWTHKLLPDCLWCKKPLK